MNRIIALLTLSLTTTCIPLSAQSNWVTAFLERYRPPLSAPANTSGADTIQTAIQSGVLSLTTADVVRFLLENNRDILVNRLGPLSSQFAIEALFRNLEPNVHFGATVDRTKSPSRSQLIGAAALNQLTHNYTVGIDQNLEAGTSYGVDFSMNRSSSNSAFNLFNPSWAGSLTFAVTQPLLRNFGRNINTRQIHIARNNEKISEIQFETQVITLVSQAGQAYWELVFNREDVNVKQRSLDLALKTEQDNEVQVNIGTLASIELVQSQAEVATRREDLITSQHNAEQLEDQVKKLITNATDPGMVVARLDPKEQVREPSDRDVLPIKEAIQSALENRPEMHQADYQIANSDVDVQYTRNQTLPILDVNAKYTQSGVGGTRTITTGLGSQVVQVIPGGSGDVFTQLFGLDFPGYTAGVSVQIPITNRAARADYSRAVNDQRTANLHKDALAQQIALEVRNALTQVDLNRARIETARTAHQLAIRRLDAEQKKFELGTSTVRFVLEEQRNLAQAETNEIQALVNYAKALVEYHRSVGDTLKENHIDIARQLPSSAAGAK